MTAAEFPDGSGMRWGPILSPRRSRSLPAHAVAVSAWAIQVEAIAVPNYVQAEIAIAALEVGKDVLREKPIGLACEEAIQAAPALDPVVEPA